MSDTRLTDAWTSRAKGRVEQFRVVGGKYELIKDGSNLVVDAALETMILALMGAESLKGVELGYSGGRPVSKGLRSTPSPVAFAPFGATAETLPVASQDSAGLRSIGTWTAVYTASQPVTYDTLGMVSTSNLLFAAIAFDAVPLVGGETIAIRWSILMRGAA